MADNTITGTVERREVGLALNFTAKKQIETPTEASVQSASREQQLSTQIPRAEVPIHETVLSDGTPRYSIPIRIGNSIPIEAMLDTGSTGLRILPGAVSPMSYAITSRVNNYGYGSGVKVTGLIANASVSIGGTVTNAPIPIQVIQTVGCFESKPQCPASRIGQADYGLGGDGLANEGFKAIIGIGMPLRGANYDVVNPLLYLGHQSWVVILPLDQSTSGRLIINPDAEDLDGFTVLSDLIAMPGFQQEGIYTCLSDQNSGNTVCGPAVLDTGAPRVTVNTAFYKPRAWTEGMRGSIAFGETKAMSFKMDFTVNRMTPGYGVIVEPPILPGSTIISAGVLPFLSFAVLYDARDNTMGLRPRTR